MSPSAVGVDQQQLSDLANQYLYDNPYGSLWQDPQCSLFDVAKMLFTGKLILVEHRRCVPGTISAEWTARDLRCGDAADFQGSERDVMFLSMVAAPEAGRRYAALTRDLYVQRYNVAASRAKD